MICNFKNSKTWSNNDKTLYRALLKLKTTTCISDYLGSNDHFNTISLSYNLYNQLCNIYIIFFAILSRAFADRMGIPHLQQVLSKELTTHIDRTLPDLMAMLKAKKREAEQELNQLQDTVLPENVLDRYEL